MATHDYIISNASGAAVRADLNNALAAIVSNNSNGSSPSTTYPYQWWADTTANRLRLRNSTNNAWVTICELDGTMLMEDGTVSLPGLAFESDENTGFFRSAADTLAIATAGAQRVTVDSSGKVGIATTSPGRTLDVDGVIRADGTSGALALGSNSSTPSEGAAIHRPANNTMAFVTGNAEKARLDSNGRLLVGTTTEGHNDADNLTIADSSKAGITIRNTTATGDGAIFFSDGDSGGAGEYAGFIEYSHSSNYLRFATNATEAMRLDSSGNLFVGRTSSGQTGNGHSIRGADSAIFSRDSNGGETMIVCRNNSEGDMIQFRRNNTICGEIRNNGANTVSYQTSSDYRLKVNVISIADGITRIKRLSPIRVNFIAEADKTVDGFLAHEAQAVVPEAVSGTRDAVDADGNAVMQGIDQAKLVPLLTAALQEAIAKIETLETKVAALEAG